MKGLGGFNLFTPIYLCALLARNQSQILLEMGNCSVPPKNQYVLHYYCQLSCSLQRLGIEKLFLNPLHFWTKQSLNIMYSCIYISSHVKQMTQND